MTVLFAKERTEYFAATGQAILQIADDTRDPHGYGVALVPTGLSLY
jgi:hypothetical protein